jgi:dTMP kinase
MRGRFITLEGMDGAGKSSHLSWIPDFFASRGIKLCVTREPGGTPLGEALRQMLLNTTQKSHPDTEAYRSSHRTRLILRTMGAL